MQIVSYVIEAPNVTSDQLQALSNIARNASENGILSEYVLYPGKHPKLRDHVSVVSSESKDISPLQKAIASSSGGKIIITTLANALADTKSTLAFQASQPNDYDLTIPMTNSNAVLHYAGLRRLKNIRYMILAKDFAARQSSSLVNFPLIVKAADKNLSLKFIEQTETNLPDIIIPNLLFPRPIYKIIKRRLNEKKNTLITSYRRRKDARLRRLVPNVTYSHNIPVFIICRDRVEPLKELVKWCEDEGLTNLIFIDNASTYKPLLDYFTDTPHEVIRLRENIGHTAPWVCGAVDIYANNRPFIVTDPDVIPLKASHGAVKKFCELLSKYPIRRKVGFGLKIDDLPDHYELKKHVIAWEKQFWVSSVEDDVFDAEIDTTFALYRQNTPYVMGPGLRTGGNYVARHEPWYIDSKNLSEEVRYYREHANKAVGSWGVDESELSDTYSGNSFKSNK